MPKESKISLNLIQHKAIEHHIISPLKVIAGAGTGKTLVLTHRFVNILKKYRDIKPYNILALTFTNKAALEMKERIIELAKNEGIDILNYPLWIGTFHSFCGRILRENAFEAGLDPNFVILTEADIKQIHQRIVEDFLNLRLNTDQFKPEEYNYVIFHSTDFLYSEMINFISKLKDSLISPEDFKNLADAGMKKYQESLNSLLEEVMTIKNISSQTKKALNERRSDSIPIDYGYEAEMINIIYHIYRVFQGYLDRNNMMDFSDLIFKTYHLLDRNQDLRQRYKQQFKYILVDEFQDTNEAQFKLLCLLACNERLTNVTIVGDDKQAIYGWRNARVENVDDFDTDAWDGLSLNVSLNYRSYGEILDFAHYAIIHEEKFQKKAEDIRLEPAGLGMANKPIVVMYEANSREQEATFIAREIIQLLKTGIEPGDIIILMRSVKPVKTYEDIFRKFQIPYR
ncbi:hypothetical protein FJZ33_03905, partial [Candidatus Poribacteria bacterium]|nr:hypothetical protein [Candidatus Poribacteria bacterium]